MFNKSATPRALRTQVFRIIAVGTIIGISLYKNVHNNIIIVSIGVADVNNTYTYNTAGTRAAVSWKNRNNRKKKIINTYRYLHVDCSKSDLFILRSRCIAEVLFCTLHIRAVCVWLNF